MADLKISQLPGVATPTAADLFVTVSGGTTSQVTRQQLHTVLNGDDFNLDTGGEIVGLGGILRMSATSISNAMVQLNAEDPAYSATYFPLAVKSSGAFIDFLSGSDTMGRLSKSSNGLSLIAGGFNVRPDVASVIPFYVQGVALQTADLFQVRDSAATEFLTVEAGGNTVIGAGKELRLYDSLNSRSSSLYHSSSNMLVKANAGGQNLIFDDWSQVLVRSGAVFRILDSTDGDYAQFQHDSTDFNTTFNATLDWRVSGLTSTMAFDVPVFSLEGAAQFRLYDGANTKYMRVDNFGTYINFQHVGTTDWFIDDLSTLSLRDAAQFRIYDSLNTNYVEMDLVSPTVFNTTFTNVATAVWSGLTSEYQFKGGDFRIMGPQDGSLTTLYIGDTTVYANNSADGRLVMYGEHNSIKYGFQMSVASGNVSLSGTTEGGVTAASTLQIPMNFQQTSGASHTFLDPTNADTAAFSHDGTDFNTVFTGTTDWNITGANVNLGSGSITMTGNNTMSSGGLLYLYSASNALYTRLRQENSRASIFSNSPANPMDLEGWLRWSLRDGAGFRIYDALDTDYVEFQHDGTDLNVTATNTNYFELIGFANGLRVDSGATGGPHIQLAGTNNPYISYANGQLLQGLTNGGLQFSTGTAAGASLIFHANNATGVIRGTIASVTQWEAISNQRFRFYANPATSYAEFQHDATDFLTTFTNTDKWTISGMTGGVEVDGFLSVQQPVNPFNPFHSDGKVFDSIRTNRFHGRQDQLFVSVDAVELTTTKEWLFDGTYDSLTQMGVAAGADVVLLIDFEPYGLTTSDGFTYSGGRFHLYSYQGKAPDAVTARVQTRDSVWHTCTVAVVGQDAVGDPVYEVTIPGAAFNYVRKAEFTLTPQATTNIWLSQVEYHGDRMQMKQGGDITRYSLTQQERITGNWNFVGPDAFRVLTDINTATPPTSEAVIGRMRWFDADETDQLAEFGFLGNNQFGFTNNMRGGGVIFKGENDSGTLMNLLYLDPGNVSVFYDPVVSGLQVFRVETNGVVAVRSNDSLDTSTRRLDFQHQDGTVRAYIGHTNASQLNIINAIHGGPINLTTEDSGGTARPAFYFNPAGGGIFYHGTGQVASTIASGLNINRISNATSELIIGEETTLRGSSQDARIEMFAEEAGAIYGAAIAVGGNNLQFLGVGANPIGGMQFSMALTMLNGQPIYIQDGGAFRIYSPDDTNYLNLTVADNGIATMTGTDIVNLVFTGISGSIDINGGTALRFKDATNVDEVNMSHDGTDFLVIPSINTIDLMLGDEVGTASQWSTVKIPGATLRVYDTSPSTHGVILGTTTNNGSDFGTIGPLGTGGIVINDNWFYSTGGNQDRFVFSRTNKPNGTFKEQSMEFRTDNTSIGWDYVWRTGSSSTQIIEQDIIQQDAIGTGTVQWKLLDNGQPRVVLDLTSTLTRDLFDLYAGIGLRIRNSLNGDYAEFHHDGTDFNTEFTNTADWNVTGLTGGVIIDDGQLTIHDGSTVPLLGDARVEIGDYGGVLGGPNKVLSLNSSSGIVGGQTGPFYGVWADISPNNDATDVYGGYFEVAQATVQNVYGVWAQASQGNSTNDNIGVLGWADTESASTNHRANRALGTGPVAGVYAKATTFNATNTAQTTALYATNESVFANESYGVWINTVAGPTTITPFRIDHAGNTILDMLVNSKDFRLRDGYRLQIFETADIKYGEINHSGTNFRVQMDASTAYFQVETTGDANAFIVQNSTGRVGIKTTSLGYDFNVATNMGFANETGLISGVTTLRTNGTSTGQMTFGTENARFGGDVSGARLAVLGKATGPAIGVQEGFAGQDLFLFKDTGNNALLGLNVDGFFFDGATGNGIERLAVFNKVTPASANGDGAGVNLRTENSSGNGRDLAYMDAQYDTIASDIVTMRFSVRPGSLDANPTEVMRLEGTGALGSGETSLWLYDNDNGTLEQVTVGAADSGGSGFKVLRIPN